MLTFIIGLFVGAFFGFLAAILCAASRRGEDMERFMEDKNE